MEILKQLSDFKKKFDLEFFKYLDKKEKELVKINPKIAPVFAQVKKIARVGKRLRAFICTLGFQGFDGKDKQKILSVSIGMELLQLFILIHDDIMDKDNFRRGIETIHYKFTKRFNSQSLGNSIAILVGDLVFSLSEEIIPQTVIAYQFSHASRVLDYWQKLKKEVMVGQYLDITAGLKFKSLKSVKNKEKNIFKIMELKTVSYSVLRPLQIGAALAGADKDEIEKLQDFAIPAGIAFQLRDDILDFEKSEAISLVTLKGENYCQKLAEKLVLKAKEGLENVKIRKQEKELLSQLADFMVERKF